MDSWLRLLLDFAGTLAILYSVAATAVSAIFLAAL